MQKNATASCLSTFEATKATRSGAVEESRISTICTRSLFVFASCATTRRRRHSLLATVAVGGSALVSPIRIAAKKGLSPANTSSTRYWNLPD